MIRPPLSCVKKSAASWAILPPGDGAGGVMMYCGEGQRRRDQCRARRIQGVDGKGSGGGAWVGVAIPLLCPTSRRPRCPRAEAEAEAKGPEIGRGRIQRSGTPASRRAQKGARNGANLRYQDSDDTERPGQLVHKRARAIAFIVSICCLLIAGAGYIPSFFSSRPGSPTLGLGRPKL